MAVIMLLVATAIAASAPQLPHQTAAPAIQATATVRILAGVRLRLGEHQARDGFIARDSVVRIAGSSQAAKLIEFE